MEEKKCNEISWTHLPVFRSLTETILYMDGPREFIIWNLGIAAFFLLCFGLKFWPILVMNVIAHFTVRYFSLEDAQFFECFHRYWAKRDYYAA